MASFLSFVVLAGGLFFLSLHMFAVSAQFYVESSSPAKKIFNVLSSGANPDGKTDNSEAFKKAFYAACQWINLKGQNVVLIPSGNFMVNHVSFVGPCKSPIVFSLQGVLKAPSNPALFFSDTWIGFRYINGLVIEGGGTIDGQGAFAWPYNDCKRNPKCKTLPASLRFDFVNNGKLQNLRSINSKNVHLTLFACHNFDITNVKLTAPNDSPNTDGIKIGASTNIKISHSIIGTGDDCIAMISGSENIDIFDVLCGPGHGISIGSLGNNIEKEFVKGINVRNCTFISTQNGVRIKTRPSSFPSFVSNVSFSGITMKDVNNPLIIDQQYSPNAEWFYQEKLNAGGVMINNVKFEDIRGTSTSEIAIKLHCSAEFPCQNVKLGNINLAYTGSTRNIKQTTSSCVNVKGQPFGRIQPPGCL
ncbi:hypothetical protein LIER_35057 [Lithospermum erythrorhizon]|uniref:Uncharacterized protein n=1 Tax=Lithospermum erythrorhizon TaxID=34254 RepID=A0AAV3NK34_LITER